MIDKEEINKYNLFPGVKGLQSAVFLKLPDGSYVLKTTYIDETTGEEKVEITTVSESTIKIYGSIIDKFKEIQVESKEKKKEQKVEKPPLNGGRIASEILSGTGLGFLGYILRWRIGDPSIVGDVVGLTFGSSLGVYIVGNIGNETGSYLATLAGSACGTGISYILYVYDIYNIFSVSLPPSILGTIGFNLTLRYKTPPESETALINFRDGQTSFAFPKIYFRPNPFNKGDLIQTVDLVKVRF